MTDIAKGGAEMTGVAAIEMTQSDAEAIDAAEIDNVATDAAEEKGTESANAMTPREMAIIAARAADAKKATDIVVQNVGDIISVTDYFVIVTAANSRQVNAIIDEIEEAERLQAHIKPLHREETRDGSWELLDYGSVVVHVFQPETREYYRLEALWNDAPVMDLAAEAGIEGAVYSDRIAAILNGQGADQASEEGLAEPELS